MAQRVRRSASSCWRVLSMKVIALMSTFASADSAAACNDVAALNASDAAFGLPDVSVSSARLIRYTDRRATSSGMSAARSSAFCSVTDQGAAPRACLRELVRGHHVPIGLCVFSASRGARTARRRTRRRSAHPIGDVLEPFLLDGEAHTIAIIEAPAAAEIAAHAPPPGWANQAPDRPVPGRTRPGVGCPRSAPSAGATRDLVAGPLAQAPPVPPARGALPPVCPVGSRTRGAPTVAHVPPSRVSPPGSGSPGSNPPSSTCSTSPGGSAASGPSPTISVVDDLQRPRGAPRARPHRTPRRARSLVVDEVHRHRRRTRAPARRSRSPAPPGGPRRIPGRLRAIAFAASSSSPESRR